MKVAAGELTLNKAKAIARDVQKSKASNIAETPQETTQDMVPVVNLEGEVREVHKPKSARFNRTNNSVDWASWTWKNTASNSTTKSC